MKKIFLDTETTGLDPRIHSVWEIAYAVDDDIVLSCIVPHSLVGANPEALKVNNYTKRIAQSAPWWESESPLEVQLRFESEFREALKGSVIVAANPAFDAGMLFARYGEQTWHYRMIDVETYAMPLLGLTEPKGLAYIAEKLGIVAPDHSAANDVRTLRKCYQELELSYRGQF